MNKKYIKSDKNENLYIENAPQILTPASIERTDYTSIEQIENKFHLYYYKSLGVLMYVCGFFVPNRLQNY